MPGKTILVDNVLTTLQKLASFHRKKFGLPILAITGSNGKTTTKELVAAVLSQKFNISFTKGNLNNHIGVPLTLLDMNSTTDIGVVEMGANHPGEIDALCKIASPDYGIITNIGRAHLEGFGSFEGIKRTKSELYNYLEKKGGTIFYNSDDTILKELAEKITNKLSYGITNSAITGKPQHSKPFIKVKINLPDGEIEVKTQLTGIYNFYNIMAAVSVGSYFGVNPSQIKSALQNYIPENNRSQLIEKNGLTIIMDAYNANPTSMQAAIESFVSGFQGHRCLILGDMLELGNYSAQEHNEVIKQIKKYSFEKVFLIGPAFSEAGQNSPFHTFNDTGEFCLYLSQNKLTKCAVLIKGSRGIKLEKVLEYL